MAQRQKSLHLVGRVLVLLTHNTLLPRMAPGYASTTPELPGGAQASGCTKHAAGACLLPGLRVVAQDPGMGVGLVLVLQLAAHLLCSAARLLPEAGCWERGHGRTGSLRGLQHSGCVPRGVYRATEEAS